MVPPIDYAIMQRRGRPRGFSSVSVGVTVFFVFVFGRIVIAVISEA